MCPDADGWSLMYHMEPETEKIRKRTENKADIAQKIRSY